MRKRKIAGAAALALSLCMTVAAITGCGNQASTAQNSTAQNSTSGAEEEAFRGGGKGRELEAYLKQILQGKDKAKLLLDQGTSVTLEPNNVGSGANNSFVIVRRVKDSVEKGTAELAALEANKNDIWPGSIIHADSKLVDGKPSAIVGGDIKRKPVEISVDLNNNTQPPATVENPTQGTVQAAINTMVTNWLNSGNSAAAKVKNTSSMVYSEKQVEADLGIKDADDKFGVDLQAISEGKKQEMLVVFDQIYYTARIDSLTISDLVVDSGADAVTVDDLKANGVDESNPGLAAVTSVSYGRKIVVRMSTESSSTDVAAAWKASIAGTSISNDTKYKSVMDNTTFSVYAYGGSTSTAGELVANTKDISKVNEIIAKDVNFDKNAAAALLSYSTHFLDDGSPATVNRSTEYIKTTVETRKQVNFKTNNGGVYRCKSQKLYGRPITGVDEKGNIQLGGWEKLMDESTGDQSRQISGKYAEFGFSFDVSAGTNWPYTGVFWTLDKGAAEDIEISWGGGARTVWVKIKVNGNEIFSDSNCSGHDEYNFGV
ncbi:MAG: thiol-activated cytolysin family protein [Lachnospiraceae bacterium]|nr:thiol-activated cytolysin family protein [Lachnospiraceae bacterium]MBQ6258918.1 thiol-activated cytolysin family protein [Lachnospiraceae bacterium]